MKFAFMPAEWVSFLVGRCAAFWCVNQSGHFAWHEGSACVCRQTKKVNLPLISTAFALWNGTYGSSWKHRDGNYGGH